MHRQIILDTETTGLRVEEGHRIIEIGCIEMIDRKLTGQHFHRYLNPQREVEEGALAIHGITNEFLHDKPSFSDIAQDLIDFITDSEIIIHNAPFDLSFINSELNLTRQGFKMLTDYCQVTDTLQMARQLHVGQRNSLDALCKRYGVDHSKRELHGALLDAHLLAEVYLAMTGGQGSFFDHPHEASAKRLTKSDVVQPLEQQKYQLDVLKAAQEELSAHHQYLSNMKKQGKCIWPMDD